jgi:uncharacterized membrane protein (UPF0127 family)
MFADHRIPPAAAGDSFQTIMKLRLKPLVALISFALLTTCQAPQPDSVSLRGHRFYVELAITAEERSRGLMFREQLEPDKGMLFIFEQEGVYPFWMKNVVIPLDIIWIDKDGKVVAISKDTRPCTEEPCPSINPGLKARYVLELCGGTADKIGLVVGEEVEFQVSRSGEGFTLP